MKESEVLKNKGGRGMSRRNFLKYGLGGTAALVVGTRMPWLTDNEAYAAHHVQTLNFTITDAMKEMVTHNAVNDARCYFWIYKEDRFPADCPGPHIFTTEGNFVVVNITNALDEAHAFFIPGMVDSGPIAPGASRTLRFKVPRAGTFLYYDNLNAPVNRVMGLHGAFIVMPRAAAPGQKFTPYGQPTPAVPQLFNDLGVAGPNAPWPGLGWEEGDPTSNPPTLAFRQYIWLLHQASPVLFQEVGSFTPGLDFPAQTFVNGFLNDPFIATGTGGITVHNRKPQFFTINGQSGHFSHNNPFHCPNLRVGEPAVVRILNAGLWMHSTHIHANHVFVIAHNNVVQENPIWIDVFTSFPLSTYDWLVPYMRPPDVPNLRGIGLADPGIPTQTGGTTWPPLGELSLVIGGVQLAPICYPMHDHSEPSQTAQGGTYNMGLISGINFTGDRNTPGGVTTFPNAPLTHGPDRTGPAAPVE
ncbi:MAG: multicopper oxidase domain-containing protein [Deltaproteobacteria bacterium]|nr:multicopper oxidase domain-containing protein [Deltaproteobacteria bacterium]